MIGRSPHIRATVAVVALLISVCSSRAQIVRGMVHARSAGQPDSVQISDGTYFVRRGINAVDEYTYEASSLEGAVSISATDSSFGLTSWPNDTSPVFDVYANGVSLVIWDIVGRPSSCSRQGVTFRIGPRRVYGELPLGMRGSGSFWYYSLDVSPIGPVRGEAGHAYYWALDGTGHLFFDSLSVPVDGSYGPDVVLATPGVLKGSVNLSNNVKSIPRYFAIDSTTRAHTSGYTNLEAFVSNTDIPPWSFGGHASVTMRVNGHTLLGDDTLADGLSSTTVTLSPAVYLTSGVYACTTVVTPGSDTCFSTLTVTGTPQTLGWTLCDSMPAAPTNAKCRAGTDLCIDDNGTIHAIKGGSRSLEYYAYSLDRGWLTGTNLPPGAKGRPKKGASLVYAAGKVYYKESYGPGFWCKDTQPTAVWNELAGFTRDGRVAKGGTSLAYDPATGTILMTAGGLKSEDKRPVFAYYSIDGNVWSMDSLPLAATAESKFSDGAAVTWAAGYAYVTTGKGVDLCRGGYGTWQRAASVPATRGKFKGDIVFLDGCIYASEGNNSQAFSRYDTSSGAWQTLEPWPLGGSSRTKKAKYPALATYEGVIMAMAGNNTRDLWMYVPPVTGDGREAVKRTTTQAGLVDTRPTFTFTLGPVVSGYATANWSGGSPTASVLSLYDVTGRCTRTVTLSGASGSTQLHGLAAGVYVARVSGGVDLARKLVIK